MDGLIISEECTLCGKCFDVCLFVALEIAGNKVQVSDRCNLYGI